MVHILIWLLQQIYLLFKLLTHWIDENVCVWDDSCGFSSELTGDYRDGGFRGKNFP